MKELKKKGTLKERLLALDCKTDFTPEIMDHILINDKDYEDYMESHTSFGIVRLVEMILLSLLVWALVNGAILFLP